LASRRPLLRKASLKVWARAAFAASAGCAGPGASVLHGAHRSTSAILALYQFMNIEMDRLIVR
jgi:hypothetical protein